MMQASKYIFWGALRHHEKRWRNSANICGNWYGHRLQPLWNELDERGHNARAVFAPFEFPDEDLYKKLSEYGDFTSAGPGN